MPETVSSNILNEVVSKFGSNLFDFKQNNYCYVHIVNK